jgi:putative membrane protein
MAARSRRAGQGVRRGRVAPLRALDPAILPAPRGGNDRRQRRLTSLSQQLEIEMARDSRLGLALTTAALALMASAGVAQTSLSDTDRQFIEQAAEGGHAEVSMGQSAAKSENPAVSAFGKQMIADHTKLNDQLAAVAKEKGVEPPASPDLGSQAKGAMTSVLPGKTFDSQYVSSQLDDHKETLALFQQEAQSGQDPDLKALAKKGIPVIQEHIAKLEHLQKMPELQ